MSHMSGISRILYLLYVSMPGPLQPLLVVGEGVAMTVVLVVVVEAARLEEAGAGGQVLLGIHLSLELEAVLEQVVVLWTLRTGTWIVDTDEDQLQYT